MKKNELFSFVEKILEHMPTDWLVKTTHRLDIYNEDLAKVQFLEQLEELCDQNEYEKDILSGLPTAYDYIRLGHPLSCLLEWALAKVSGLDSKNVISFSSNAMPLLAVLRKNLLNRKNTRIVYQNKLPEFFDADTLKSVYGYDFDVMKVESLNTIPVSDDTTVCILENKDFGDLDLKPNIDILINMHHSLGSLVVVNGKRSEAFISEIQHVRRRESIAMTPGNSLKALRALISEVDVEAAVNVAHSKKQVLTTISEITETSAKAILGSCGLSVQYAITMGLVHDALIKHPDKKIKIIVPPNCYGGTNDQARRVAACVDHVEVMDLPVDAGSDMAGSVEQVLNECAALDAVPLIIAEIPTNPRVEVPELLKLKDALTKVRFTPGRKNAVEPVFILDQTFCPNVHFLGEGEILSSVKTISYVSGSKFPSGGLCTAGYCVANKKAENLMVKIEKHLRISDNEATEQQIEVLAKQMPSMNQRISEAYQNTRDFVDFIKKTLPTAKINFVSEELAGEGFTPSVFSLNLPAQNEKHKRELNHKLIQMMIEQVPNESQHCVSYGQLKGCYWTVPATSTQGTTKEGDKDYIVRVAVSPDMDVEKHKQVFLQFCNENT